MPATLEWTYENDYYAFFLIDAIGSRVPFTKWIDHGSSSVVASAAVLASLEQAGLAALLDDRATLAIEALRVASLDEDRARAIGLPPSCPFLLQIDSQGALGRMHLDIRWIDTSGLRIREAFVQGASLVVEERQYRLASPLLEIVRAVTSFNARTDFGPVEQAATWAQIRDLIGADAEQVRPGRYLERLRIARATKFSLDFVPGDDGCFQIAPVPLADHVWQPASDDDSTAPQAQHSESIRLLSAVEETRFQRAFRARQEAQTAYLGGSDVYVLLAPEVQRSLSVVRKMQDRPVEERLAFARNPFPYLRDASALDDEPPFIESRSFSDRVLGLGKIDKVVLPWQILSSQGWLPPETVHIRIDGRDLDITPTSIDPAIIDLEHAMSAGLPNVIVEGHEIPAVGNTRDAFLEARGALDAQAAEDTAPSLRTSRSEPLERIGLQVKRNLEEAAYAALRAERSIVPFGLPEIVTELKQHQTEAVAWLQRRWTNGHRGALLADDMGLGKTLSALTFMLWLREQMLRERLAKKPILIVAPVSLLESWQAEHERHIGDRDVRFIDIVRAYGLTLPRRHVGRDVNSGAAMLDLDRLSVDRFGDPTCVLTTYETLRDYQQSFAAIHFALVVLDETQRIKNPASLSWHAVSALHSDFWLALTGTPVENRLADLWAIADVIEPGLLGTLKDFSSTYEGTFNEALLRGLKASLEHSDDNAPFMLRRLKEHVLDGLPPKHEHVRSRPMPLVQSTAYGAVVQESQGFRSRGQMLAIIQKLRDVSLHPLRPTEVDADSYIAASARFQSLFIILDQIRADGEKALVFLDRNVVEAYLARLIQSRYALDRFPSIINGEVEPRRRQKFVDEFQARHGFDVMLLSPKAGGVGLTLTAANHVIHLSRWWNPAVEDQSTDRVYRIGQRKPVHVYYLQATLPGKPNDSFDERLNSLLQTKRKLSRELLWPMSSDEGDAAALLGSTARPQAGGTG